MGRPSKRSVGSSASPAPAGKAARKADADNPQPLVGPNSKVMMDVMGYIGRMQNHPILAGLEDADALTVAEGARVSRINHADFSRALQMAEPSLDQFFYSAGISRYA